MTLRARGGLPSFRLPLLFRTVRAAFLAAKINRSVRVVHFSVQTDHLHILLEAPDKRALCLGTRGLIVRLARALNRTLGRRGSVWGVRYHTHAARSPREVRNALVYVLMNFRKHLRYKGTALDPCSSAVWSGAFAPGRASPDAAAPVWPPGTWLLAVGWRRHGLLSPSESPRPTPREG